MSAKFWGIAALISLLTGFTIFMVVGAHSNAFRMISSVFLFLSLWMNKQRDDAIARKKSAALREALGEDPLPF